MKIKFFTVPVFSGEDDAAELNRFIASRRVIETDRQFIADGVNSVWSFCICYIEAGERPPPTKKGKIDYKDVLNEEDFTLYSQLRDLRKRLAEQEAVPVYALFANEQLATMVRRRVTTASQLREIDGIGEARVEKYGKAFLDLLKQSFVSTNQS